ncbi:MAG: NAD(P)H-dependent oxidoreductase [bacterium]|nr:NAD(P)H-dependent oxidoreductase [bacterium]
MKKLNIFLASILTTLTFNAQAKENKMNKKLVVYFSKSGNQYSVGNVKKGNTAKVAEIIANQTGADVFEVKVKNDNYPTEYEPLTKRAKKEQEQKLRPEIVGKVENFSDYDTVFIGSPVWWGDMPMALYTFIESYDWDGKTVAPFVTHEGSGLSSIPLNIKNITNANVLSGLAIYGHEAQNEPEKTKAKVDNWLKQNKLD